MKNKLKAPNAYRTYRILKTKLVKHKLRKTDCINCHMFLNPFLSIHFAI